MLLVNGINPFPYALNEIDYGEFVILRVVMSEIRKKNKHDEFEMMKIMMR